MSKWITDRAPKREDALCGRIMVWGKWHQEPFLEAFDDWDGSPWMPIPRPEPYVKPKRYVVCNSITGSSVFDNVARLYVGTNIPTREAAERIAAIYNEVMP